MLNIAEIDKAYYHDLTVYSNTCTTGHFVPPLQLYIDI